MDFTKCLLLLLIMALELSDSFAQDTKDKGDENKIKPSSSKKPAGKQLPKTSTELKKGTSVAFPRRLLQYYDRDMMPPSSTPLKVNVNFQLQKNVAMNLKANSLDTGFQLHVQWTDTRLRWDPRRNNITVIRLPATTLWTPDLIVLNSIPGHKSYDLASSKCIVTAMGTVIWLPSASYRSVCQINMNYFPQDYHICHVIVGSLIYGPSVSYLLTNESFADVKFGMIAQKTKDDEWNIIRPLKAKLLPMEHGTNIIMTFVVQRNPGIYMHFFFNLPCLLVSLLPIVWCLPPNSRQKKSLGLLFMLCFCAILLLFNFCMGGVFSSVPALMFYIFCAMCLIVPTLLMAIIVQEVEARGGTNKRLPRCLITFMFARFGIGRVLTIARKRRESVSIQLERKGSRADYVEYHTPSGEQDPVTSGNGDAVKLNIKEVSRSRSKRDNLQEWIYLVQVIDRLMLLFYVVAVSVMFVITFTLK